MNQRGFTLIELLVTASLIIFLSTIILANWRSGQGELLLERSVYKLAQDIRRSGELAMSAREFQGVIPSGGYGVHLKSANDDYYILYADTNGNEKYDGSDGIVETIYFEKGVFIHSLSKNNLSLNFKPPNPKITIDGLSAATITITSQSASNKTKQVKINVVGLIEVE